MNRRVLILDQNLPVPFDRRVWQEAVALVKAGYSVSVVCPTGRFAEASHEELDGVDIQRFPAPPEADGVAGYVIEYGWSLLSMAWAMLRVAARRGRPDVIHLCNPPDLLFLLAWPFRLLGTRVLFDHHDLCPELFESKQTGPGGRAYRFLMHVLRALEWLTFRTARVVISTNESYRAVALDPQRGGKNAADVFVVRSGPDLSRVYPVDPDPTLRNGRRILVGYVGVIGFQEGIDLLIEAAAHIEQVVGRQDIQYCIVGSGPDLDRCRKLADERGVTETFSFPGRVDDDHLRRVLSTADLCVNPDRPCDMNDKSTMNKVMEYMAMGKPLVQFDLAEGRRSAGDASLYVEGEDPAALAKAICTLADDAALRDSMGAIGKQRIEQELSWDHQVPHLVRAYQRVLGP